MVRIDMSEYMEKHTVARLIGAPPGYVGYEEGGQLTEAVRRRPYSVVLFDEIEKAHHDVFNVLLQMLDDGRLTDGQGRTVDFKNTIIIMTSNIGSPIIQEYYSAGKLALKDHAELEQRGAARNCGRTSGPSSSTAWTTSSSSTAWTRSNSRGSWTSNCSAWTSAWRSSSSRLEVDRAAKQLLAKEGYDPQFGARPLKRAIQDLLLDPLATKLLVGEFKPGDRIKVVAQDGALEFEKK